MKPAPPPPPPPSASAVKPVSYKEQQERDRKSALTVRERRWEDIYPLHAAAQRGDYIDIERLARMRDVNQQVSFRQ